MSELRQRALDSLHQYDCWASERPDGTKDHDECWQIVDAVLAPSVEAAASREAHDCIYSSCFDLHCNHPTRAPEPAP